MKLLSFVDSNAADFEKAKFEKAIFEKAGWMERLVEESLSLDWEYYSK